MFHKDFLNFHPLVWGALPKADQQFFIQEKVDLLNTKRHKGRNFYTDTQSDLNGHYLLRFIWLYRCLVYHGMNPVI